MCMALRIVPLWVSLVFSWLDWSWVLCSGTWGAVAHGRHSRAMMWCLAGVARWRARAEEYSRRVESAEGSQPGAAPLSDAHAPVRASLSEWRGASIRWNRRGRANTVPSRVSCASP